MKLLEDIGKLYDALSNILDFAFTLGYESLVRVMTKSLLLGLEQRGLGKRAVSVGFLERRIVIRVLDRGTGAKWGAKATKITEF